MFKSLQNLKPPSIPRIASMPLRLYSFGAPAMLFSEHGVWLCACGLAFVIAMLFLAPSTARAQDVSPSKPAANVPLPKADDNAALQYWQAFALVQQPDPTQRSWLDSPGKTVLNDAVEKYLDSNVGALRLLYHGAQKPRCDWGVDYAVDGPGTLMPHLAKVRELARLASLRARMDFSKGRQAWWVTNIASTFKLARDVSEGPLISRLVGSSTQAFAIDAAVADIPLADKATLELLASRLDALPPMTSLSRNMGYEKAGFTLWLLPKLEAIRKLVGEDPKLAKVKSIDLEREIDGLGEIGSAAELDAGDTPKKIDHMLAQVQAATVLWDQAMTALDQPLDRSIPALDAFEKGKDSWPQFARMFLPSVKNARITIARSDTQFALFRAGVAVALHGPDELAKYPDPSTGKRFEYTARGEHAFDLSSSFAGLGPPVKYTFGKP